MKKSKHFRKDVITARVIAGVLLILVIVLLVWGISLLSKPSGEDKDSQNSQNTENTQNDIPEYPDTEGLSTEEENTEGVEDTQDTSTEEEDTEPVPETMFWIETTANLRLRVEPNTSCETLEQIPEGTRLGVLEDLERWYKVKYNGKEGYVSKTYVEVLPDE